MSVRAAVAVVVALSAGLVGGRAGAVVPPPPPFQPSALPGPALSGPHEIHTGDFAGDGRTDVFLYGGGAGDDRILVARDGGFDAKAIRIYSQFHIAVGNFGGNAKDDIAFIGRTRSSVWISTGTGTFTKHDDAGGTGAFNLTPVVGRFTPGSSYDDIFQYGGANQPDALWRFSAAGTHTVTRLAVNGSYQPLVGDFTESGGPGLDEVLWYGEGSSPSSLWAPSGTGFLKYSLPVHRTYYPAVGNFAGDAHTDILWAQRGPGGDSLWISQGTSTPTFTSRYVRFDADAQPLAADLDGDGWDDAYAATTGGTSTAPKDQVWRNTGTGEGRFTVLPSGSPSLPYWGISVGNVVDDGSGPATDDIVWINRRTYATGILGAA